MQSKTQHRIALENQFRDVAARATRNPLVHFKQSHPTSIQDLKQMHILLLGYHEHILSSHIPWIFSFFPHVQIFDDRYVGTLIHGTRVRPFSDLTEVVRHVGATNALAVNLNTWGYRDAFSNKKLARTLSVPYFGVNSFIVVCDYLLKADDPAWPVREYRKNQEYLLRHVDEHIAVSDFFDDDLSHSTYFSVLMGRALGTDEFFPLHCIGMRDLYFGPDSLSLQKDEVFVDAGAYDGEDTIRFLSQSNGAFSRVYVLEPVPANMQKAQQWIRKDFGSRDFFDRIEYIEKGAWDRTDTLTFFEAGRNTSFSEEIVTESSSDRKMEISVFPLDDLELDPTLIKLEIEGAERNALDGLKKTVARCRPRLAVSAYHLPDDFLALGKQIKNFGVDYRVRFRHHSLVNTTMMFYCD